jgi:hypothetical protein
VVTSRIKVKSAPHWSRMTNVYVKRSGRWQCVASHASRIANHSFPAGSTATGAQEALNESTDRTTTRETQRAGLQNSYTLCHVASHPDRADRSCFKDLAPPRSTQPAIHIRPRRDCLMETIHVKVGQDIKS